MEKATLGFRMHKIWQILKCFSKQLIWLHILNLWRVNSSLKYNTIETIHWLRNFAPARASKVYLEHWEVGYGKHDDVSIDGIFLQGGLSEKIEWGIKKESLFYNIFSPVFFSLLIILSSTNQTEQLYDMEKKWNSLGK